MIELRYKGQNYIMFGKIKIRNGVNSIPEDEFYRLMKTPLFKHRIDSGVFTVPQGTPLEKPKDKKMEKTTEKTVETKIEKEVEKPVEQQVETETETKKKSKKEDSEKRFDEIV